MTNHDIDEHAVRSFDWQVEHHLEELFAAVDRVRNQHGLTDLQIHALFERRVSYDLADAWTDYASENV